MGPSFFPQLLQTFERDALGHLLVLRSAIAAEDPKQLYREAHALRGASLTIGAHGMAAICQQLENLEMAKNAEAAPKAFAQLEYEFDRVKSEIEQENLIL
jgi:two-component system sensor histidine kinase/response regulator